MNRKRQICVEYHIKPERWSDDQKLLVRLNFLRSGERGRFNGAWSAGVVDGGPTRL